MISRIDAISKIGMFKKQSPVDFSPLTLIYGPNGSGKSTLADIFRSLWENDPDIILKRKRIDVSARSGRPEVELTLLEEGASQRQVVRFGEGRWRRPAGDWVIEIFDARYVDENVFAGLTHTRANRVSLSNLMLGRETVLMGKEVESLRREKREANKKLTELRSRLSAAGVGDINAFFLLPKPDNREELATSIAGLKERERQVQRIVEEGSQLGTLPLPESVSLECVRKCEAAADEIVAALSMTRQEVNEEAALQLDAHIKRHFLHRDGRERAWLQKGLSYAGCGGDENAAPAACPFCGGFPALEKDLFDLYRRVFSHAYREFVQHVADVLSDAFSRWRQGVAGLKNLDGHVRQNRHRAVRFQEYLDRSFVSAFEEMDDAAQELLSTLENGLDAAVALESDFTEKIRQKKEAPFADVAVEKKGPATIAENLRSLSAAVERFNQAMQTLLGPISALKAQSALSDLVSKLSDIQKEMAEKNIAAMRYDRDEEVQVCLSLQADIDRVSKRIDQLKQDIEAGNKMFAQRFFHQVQEIFQFVVGKTSLDVRADFDAKGYQPIYGFNLHLMGKAVQKQIPFVLSNADRQTLALSVYFSSLRNRKQDDSLKRTIAVLDDPVSGLDDARAGQVLQYLWRVVKSCRQTIVLSHQRQFLEDIRDKAVSENTPFAMLRIDEQNGQSVIGREGVDPSPKTAVSSDQDASRITAPVSHGSRIQMVCLANSRKYGGRCVAGKEITEDGKSAGRWLRPVSQEDWGTLSMRCIALQDGAMPNLLDIVTVPIQGPDPRHCQQENAVADPTRAWRRKGRLPIDRLPELVDDVEALWINGYDSRYGLNDRIPQDVAETRVRSSLLLIQPAELRICVEEFVNSPLKVRARFHFKNVEYGLTVTDPLVEFAYSQKPLGEYPATQKDVYLCVSLGEPFEGYCYKLAAGFVNLAV